MKIFSTVRVFVYILFIYALDNIFIFYTRTQLYVLPSFGKYSRYERDFFVVLYHRDKPYRS